MKLSSVARARLFESTCFMNLHQVAVGLFASGASLFTITASFATTSIISPEADTYVQIDRPSVNFGHYASVRVDGGPEANGYLRFNISIPTGEVVNRVTLRLFTTSPSPAGLFVNQVTSTTWGETTTNYANAPAIGPQVAASGAYSGNAYVAVDVTSLLTGNGRVSLAVRRTHPDANTYNSREATSNRPQLVVESAPAQTFRSAPVKTGLDFPTALAVAPDGTIFYGERLTGEIHTIDPASGVDRLFATIPISGTTPQSGLMSIAFHPDYPSTPYIYVSLTRSVSNQGQIQLMRLTNSGGSGTGLALLFAKLAGSDHNASQILVGPDRMLYMAIGDTGSPSLAQSLSSSAGKWLRMTLTGGVPSGNPFGSTRVWARGVRNTIGAAFDPATGRLWSEDNGPDCNEEVNRLVRGANYGWGPSAVCTTPPAAPSNTNQDGPSPTLPQVWYGPRFGPTGAAFCSPCGSLGQVSDGAFFFGAFNTGEIRRLILTSDRLAVASQSTVYDHPSAVLAIQSDRRGSLLFTDPSGIYRLVPQ
jgi:glucose/arabinose dehydrogenase